MLQEIANELDDLKAEGQKLGLRDTPDIEEQDLDDLEEIDERLEDPNFDVNFYDFYNLYEAAEYCY